ncbi:MAG: hypothetical protein M1591_10825 [Deltaproteobacteria bacterium]|nr:hypothetical protein [Deltaproteobacteria bacterium]
MSRTHEGLSHEVFGKNGKTGDRCILFKRLKKMVCCDFMKQSFQKKQKDIPVNRPVEFSLEGHVKQYGCRE